MSLYVGHLSSHIRQEELERVFRRFGWCNVQLKDGYGFVVYQATPDAERALRSLRGKPICGEQITINWSNRQPRPVQRLARTTRFNEPVQRRNFREENEEVGIRGSNARRGFYARTFHSSMYNRERQTLDGALDKKRGRTTEDITDIEGDKVVNLGMTNEGGLSALDQVENDRWGETGIDTLNSNVIDNGAEFDRYEPYHGYDKRDENENVQIDSPSSRDRGISREKRQRENSIHGNDRKIDMLKPQQTCYKCGQVGHIMRTCPKTDARREKFTKFNSSKEEVIVRDKGRRIKRFRSNSWGSPDISRDPMVSRRHKRDRKEYHSGKARGMSRECERSPEGRKRHRPKLRKDFPSKRKSKLENGASKKALKRGRHRKSRTPSCSSASDRSSPQLHSRSSRSVTGSSSPSHLRSASSRSRSVSDSRSSSYSKSVSSRSRSRSKLRSQSKSRSRSRSRSLSLSVSLEPKVTPSPINKQIGHSTKTSSYENVTSPTPEQLECNKADDACTMLEDGNPSTSFKVDNKTSGEHYGYNVDVVEDPTIRTDYNEKNMCLDHSKYESNQHEDLRLKLKRWTSTQQEASSSTRLTTEEMFLALKHYGLEAPEEGHTSITVEEYFGAARLWPWEMIYYRQSKKGPITTENYARRLEQNRQFGIVDKYIRSSSGWGEHNQQQDT
ncbi:hypothetical protein B296_00028171 [Ensete ventricosum]|uniref:CCHC-type domain-containing protein n=1 Tax=Ensete ventricosum TaxID=4639 RepID=A0A426ZIU4_ENSVE|nr:hypothetical protein B296_00028171 [Ensete ventricosum]